MNKKIIIFGTGKIAEVLYDTIINDKKSQYTIAGFTVHSKFMTTTQKFDLPVYPFENIKNFCSPDEYSFFIALGYLEMNDFRAKICKEIKKAGYNLINYVHSSIKLSPSVSIGENTFIANEVSIGPFVTIGNNSFIFSHATIAHHAAIKDNCWITSGTVIGGNSIIGNNCFLGLNSTIGHNVAVENYNFIGARAIISKNTSADSVYIEKDTAKYRLNTQDFLKLFKFDQN